MAVTTVYVLLANEDVECWRPVDAEHVKDSCYRLTGPVPDGEEWQFGTGDVVNCVLRDLSEPSGTYLVAFELSR